MRLWTLTTTVVAWWLAASTGAGAATVTAIENAKSGTEAWRLTHPALQHEIEGYASLTSVNRGGEIAVFVQTASPAYTIEIYRMGWYGGRGARLVHGPLVRQAVPQPPPAVDPRSGLVECDWRNPYLITTRADDPSEWRSGVYLVKLTAMDSGAQSYVPFVVREDDRRSALLFQTSVTTYQAYNNWGGRSLYGFNSIGGRPARKVSFDRPYAAGSHPLAASGVGAGDFLTTSAITSQAAPPAGWEYNMVRWLEREGYDVTYSTNVDTHEDPRLLLHHEAWLSIGHDEYWSWKMRQHVEQALAAGVSLGFFSANTCYWQVRLEPGTASGRADRVLVAYKDEADEEDPLALDADPANDRRVTGRWREPPVNRPEEQLIGVMYEGNPSDADMIVAAARHWAFAATGLQPGDRLPGLVGYEADRQFGAAPAGTVVLADSPYRYSGRVRRAQMTVYEQPSGALVFAAGTMQWSWALDDFNAPEVRPSRQSAAAMQITRNILERLTGSPKQ